MYARSSSTVTVRGDVFRECLLRFQSQQLHYQKNNSSPEKTHVRESDNDLDSLSEGDEYYFVGKR
jgi:hypothetical protein